MIISPRVSTNALRYIECSTCLKSKFAKYSLCTTQASKTVKIDKFPKYLLLHMRRYYVDDTWTPKKLDVKLDVPEQLSLEQFRAEDPKVRTSRNINEVTIVDSPHLATMQADELLQPEEATDDANEELLEQLVAMGFDAKQSKDALLSTGNSGKTVSMIILFAIE